MRGRLTLGAVLVIAGGLFPGAARAEAQGLGLFTGSTDVGTPSRIGGGSATYDAATKTYTVSGGGENMWAAADHFHYVWKKVSGDVLLEASLRFTGTYPASGTPDPHRKAALVIRQTLEANAVYADAASHGDGLTSLQWRDTAGDVTHEVQASIVGPTRLRVEKRGNYVSMWVAGPGQKLQPAGGAARVDLSGEFYIGLGVSAHNTGRVETATFSDVQLGTPAAGGSRTTLINTLETISLRSKDRRVVHVVTQPGRIEAPNWFPDNTNTLYFNDGGRLYKVQADPPGAPRNPSRLASPRPVDLGRLNHVNHHHGVSADGTMWAVTDESQTGEGQRQPAIYVIPAAGGAPRRLTERGPAYFEGWSPDGRTLTYSAERDGNIDVYAIPSAGGSETRLTTGKGVDEGSAYSPDGAYIYFSSEQGGAMQIWRMKADGTNPEQLTSDDSENRFPRPSPDGLSLAFLSYEKGAGAHPADKDVRLRRMNLATRSVDVLATFVGGPGTMSGASWSPNSQYLAFVSYQVVPQSGRPELTPGR